MGKRGRQFLAALSLLALAACSSGADLKSGQASASTVSVPPPTSAHGPSRARPPQNPATPPSQPFSFEVPARPPQIIDTGTDLTRICGSLIDFNQWLYAYDPDEALIPRFAAAASRTAAAAHHDLANLHRSTLRLYEVESRSRQYSMISTDGIAASLRVVQHRTQMRLVDRRGKLLDHRSFVPPSVYTVLMVKDAKGHWRIANIEEVGAVK